MLIYSLNILFGLNHGLQIRAVLGLQQSQMKILKFGNNLEQKLPLFKYCITFVLS